jgi:DNA-binding NarL/FixJ family response regulator
MKFLIIDDHPMLRQGVAAVLRDLEAGVTVLEADDGAAGLALAVQHADLACALVDLRLIGLSGLDTVAGLHRAHPALPLIMLSASEDPADVRAALAAGARGYCPKSAGHATMLAAVRLVLSGEIYVPPLMASATPALAEAPASLTGRQLEVLRLVCEGRPNKDIARQLGMQEKTVKTHVTAIFRALGVVNRAQAVIAARKAGLLD